MQCDALWENRAIDRRATLLRSEKSNQAIMAIDNATNTEFKTWMCLVCGLVYDEATGWPDDGIAAGTKWNDVPISWACPECGARKEDFEMVEI
jgi:rubredoxin